MNRQGHEKVKFFIGPEVEYTPAHAKRTLFVVGKQPAEDILAQARENRVTHIFMGANHSFSADGNAYWDKTITELLDRGLWVTLDYQAHEHDSVLNMLNAGIWQSRIFVPLLAVRIPRVQTSNPNLTIKIDDVDFAATNDGVWCMHHTEATDSNRFTSWNEYTSDEVIGEKVEQSVVKSVKQAKVVVTESLNTNTTELDPPSDEPTVLNDNSAGLDTDEKPAPVVEKNTVVSTEAAAAAYAEAEPVKVKKGKKAE